MSRGAAIDPPTARRLPWRLASRCALGLLLAAACPQLAAAQEANQDPAIVGIRMGFGHLYKVGHWTPIELTVRGGRQSLTARVRVTLPDGDGARSQVVSERPYQFLPGQTSRALLYVKPGRVDADIEVALLRGPLEASDVVARRVFAPRFEADATHQRTALLTEQELLVGIGGSIGVEGALRARNTALASGYESRYVEVNSVAQLPTRWYGYDTVDCLILSTSNAEIYRPLSETSAQLVALRQWVERGGKLVLSVGASADELLGPGGPLASFVPGRYAGATLARPSRSLETFISATEPLPEPARSRGGDGRLPAAQIADPRGRVEAQVGDDLPLVIRSPLGFGEVVFVALDLDQPPLANWSQRDRLVAKLLGFPTVSANANPAQQQNPMGFDDLSGQLRAGLDEFTGVQTAPFWLVALLIIGYIVLIGPVDYFLVKNVFKRMEYTWFTFPAIVLAVSGAAYLMAFRMKGDALLVNQVEVVDFDLTGSIASDQPQAQLRGAAWINIFSPQVQNYDVTVAPAAPGALAPADRLVAWMGLPGAGFGGMNQTTADPPMFSRAYQFSPTLDALSGVPIQVWSTKGFAARWSVASAELATAIEADLQAGFADELDGKIISRLDHNLTDCLLAWRGVAFHVGKLEPGESFAIQRVDRLPLAAELNARRGSTGDPTEITPWDVTSRDLPSIIEQMMFHKASGGENYAHRANYYHRFLDLSDHLQMNQAILVGRVQQPLGPLVLNGKTPDNPNNKRVSIYRFLLPVKPRAAG